MASPVSGQSVCTSRCAITNVSVGAIKNGSMPIATSRGITPAAVFVWIVEKTRCPVSAA